jgi:hypothetical protein
VSIFISNHKAGGAVIVAISGSLIVGEPALRLGGTIRRFLADGNTKDHFEY